MMSSGSSQHAGKRPSDFVVMRLDSARRVFRSDAAVAEALGVSRAQVTRWRKGQVPEPENADRLVGLDATIQLLTGFLSESSIPKWLTGINAHLGNRSPLSLLRQGRVGEVIGAIQAEKSGAYA